MVLHCNFDSYFDSDSESDFWFGFLLYFSSGVWFMFWFWFRLCFFFIMALNSGSNYKYINIRTKITFVPFSWLPSSSGFRKHFDFDCLLPSSASRGHCVSTQRHRAESFSISGSPHPGPDITQEKHGPRIWNEEKNEEDSVSSPSSSPSPSGDSDKCDKDLLPSQPIILSPLTLHWMRSR